MMKSFYKSITSKPIVCLEDLLEWEPQCVPRAFKVESLKNPSTFKRKNANGARILLCHDMKNNYLEDKYLQGVNAKNGYRFFDWNLIDSFIYFSHHFVTIPTESWINAAHTNGVRIYGTFITEFKSGYELCNRFLNDSETIDKVVRKLVEITLFYGFDGWLVNIENEIPLENMPRLKEFVKLLSVSLKSIDPDLYRVIWYDSVIENGKLKWQNELNEKNYDFFNLCDGFFVNYTWKTENLANTVTNAKERLDDVFVGIDVFGRGCLGDGGFKCNIAFDALRKYNLNVALFAPGWVHEANDSNDFIQNSEKFWKLIQHFAFKQRITDLPLATCFSHGCGDKFYQNGKLISSNEWFNMNLQNKVNSLVSKDVVFDIDDEPSVKWCFDDAYYGGNCIQIKGNSEYKIFDFDTEIKENETFRVDYAFKFTDSEELPSQNEFYASIEYKNNEDTSGTFVLKPNSEQTGSDIQLKKFEETLGHNNWIQWSFELRVLKSIEMQSIQLHNISSKNTKIGLLRVLPENLLHLKNNKTMSNIIESGIRVNNSYVFQFQKAYYFCVDLHWQIESTDSYLYSNIFLKIGENEIIYAGSAKDHKYSLCIKLKDYDFSYSSKNDSRTDGFNYVSVILYHVCDTLFFDDLISDQKNTISIKIPGKAKFDLIVYDFEIIS